MTLRKVGWPSVWNMWQRPEIHTISYSEKLTRKTLEDLGINVIVTLK
jgi:hypothetical protein